MTSTNSPIPKRSKRTLRTNDVHDLGPAAVGVVLQRGEVAILDRRFYRSLEARGLGGRLFLNGTGLHAYVRMEGPDNLVTVARLVVQARADEDVKYRNGNRLDLRAVNLFKVPRHGRRKTPQQTARDLFPNDAEAQAAWLQLEDRRRVAVQEVQVLAQGLRVHLTRQPAAGVPVGASFRMES